jgi:hypothetical protein
MDPRSFYDALAARHRLFYADWPRAVEREGAWLGEVLGDARRDTPGPGQRTVLFDLWHYDDPLVTFEAFFLEQGPGGWRTEVHSVRYRMWRRCQLVERLARAGLHDVRDAPCEWEIRLVACR